MTHDPQTVLDAALMRPSLRLTMVTVYRDLAEANAVLGLRDDAQRCADRASALEYGGSRGLAALIEEMAS